MKRIQLIAGVSALVLMAACGKAEAPKTEPTETAEVEILVTDAELEGNPFFTEWDTPYGVPPFDQIEEADYMPAVKKGVMELRAEIRAIVENEEAPTFENTIVALERSGETLGRVTGVFGNITNTDTTDGLQVLESEIYPMLTREYDAIALNDALWQRVKAVYEQRDSLDLNEEDARLLELTHLQFTRAGADLPPEAKAELAEINARISELTTKFGQNLLRATNAFKIEITDPAQLGGLSEDFKASIKVKGEDKWVVGLSRSQFETFMTQSTNRELRRQLFDGYRLRASSGELDNGPILIETVQLRAKRAELLGYKSHAHYVLEERMARTPEEAEAFLLQVWRPGLDRAKEELVDIEDLMARDGVEGPAEGADWWHYAEKVRQERYAFDDSVLAPYFELEATRAGMFEVANRLFGVTFEEVETPVWNPVVTSYEVRGPEGEMLGVFMMDMTSRDSKRGGAWMSGYRGAFKDAEGSWVRPIITNNLNLTPAPEGEPILMRFDEVNTLYHEFGHGLHGLLTTVGYESFSGVDGPRDYTEFPAQMMEHWAIQPEVLQEFARHYRTGEPIPMDLVEKMITASNFNQGFATTEYVAASLLDLRWHMLTYDEAMEVTDARAFEEAVLKEYGLIDQIEPRYRSQYFSHIFAGGYSAGYYAYLWSEILDADGFQAFKEAGDIYDPELAAKLKKWVYESGGLKPADELYRNFRGKDPSIEPLLEGRGFKPKT